MAINWNGATVVVTGAASGIGKALATHAASRGACVAVVDIAQASAEAVAAALRSTGADARAYGCDVSDPAAMDALARAVAADLGGTNAVFNNAGVSVGGRIDRLSVEDVSWVVAINLLGVVNGVRSFTPQLEEAAASRRPAWIVNTGSWHSLGVPASGPANIYSATKHAVLGLTDVIRHDLKGSGVSAAILCPGVVSTDFVNNIGRNRPTAFGVGKPLPKEILELANAKLSKGQDPALTAQLCFEGLDRGDFVILSDTTMRPHITARIADLEHAMAVVEQRLA
jgi:NAD(P)-dependent dehydrogenase (short-subunit alcohol dehydrogenase family)